MALEHCIEELPEKSRRMLDMRDVDELPERTSRSR